MSDLNNDIERYLRGEMTAAEMHALEKKALSDPFLADALEGGSMVDDFGADVGELNRRIHRKKSYTLGIAAGVVILLSFTLFFLWPEQQRKELAKQEVKPEIKHESIQQEKKPSEVEVEKPKEQLKQEQETRLQPEAAPLIQKHDTTNIPVIPEQEPEQPKSKTHLVAGTVTTSGDQLPLPGVTVLIKGTTMGTTTDIAGNYSIEVPDTSSLQFSFIGMDTRELAVVDKNKIDIKMTEDVSQLSEVVIARAPMPKTTDETSEIKLAEPVGGIKAYDKYLENNKRYPQQALDNDVKGRVIVGFDVSTGGELTNFVVIRSLGYGCDDEVIRLIKEGPAWNPTTESTVPVESTVHVKMKFDAVKFKKKR